ncbi:MAG: RAD55 family ATPase [Candidatus Nezhaarchaeota archaeon]|nr:RAD55 family ATPase [Candidatus Nezhaarchaeota archaeon]
MSQRARTWMPGLDEALMGGFPEGCVVALLGDTSSTHELFAKQLLYLHVANKGSATYICTRKPALDIEKEMAAYGMVAEGAKKDGRWAIIEALTRSSRESLLEIARAEMKKGRWVAIDSLSHLASLGIYSLEVEDPLTQKPLLGLVRGLVRASREAGGVHLVLVTKGIMERRTEALIEDLVDFVIDFSYDLAPGRVAHRLFVKKAGAPINTPVISFRVAKEGIVIETAVRV